MCFAQQTLLADGPLTLYVNRSVIDLDGKGLIHKESGEALRDLESKNYSVRLAPALL